MIGSPFVPQGFVDEDETGQRQIRRDLTGRGHIDDQTASTGEKLFRQQHRERRADGIADDRQSLTPPIEAIHFRMIAGPMGRQFGLPGLDQPAKDVAVGIEDAGLRQFTWRKSLLPTGLTQQILGPKYRRCAI